jgi:carboxylesterase family protein
MVRGCGVHSDRHPLQCNPTRPRFGPKGTLQGLKDQSQLADASANIGLGFLLGRQSHTYRTTRGMACGLIRTFVRLIDLVISLGSWVTSPYFNVSPHLHTTTAAGRRHCTMKTSLILLAGGLTAAAAAQDEPTIETPIGTFRGAVCPLSKVNAFTGIRFATPPVGDLRFAPPQPLNDTSNGKNIVDATKPASTCIQFNTPFGEAADQTEDWYTSPLDPHQPQEASG